MLEFAGLFLGNRKQSDPTLHMDIQTLCTSSPQLPDCICNNGPGDFPALPVGILPCGKWVEQNELQTRNSTLHDWIERGREITQLQQSQCIEKRHPRPITAIKDILSIYWTWGSCIPFHGLYFRTFGIDIFCCLYYYR